MAVQIESTPENPYNEYIITKRSIKELYFGNRELLDSICIEIKNNVDLYFKESWGEVQTTHKYAQDMLTVPKFKNLKYELLKAIDVLLKKTPFEKHSYYINQSWFNYYKIGDKQSLHNHVTHLQSGCFLSGILYLEPNNTPIEFIDFNTMRQNTIKITPKEYHLFLFDSDSLHQVYQVKEKGRVTFAFNIRFMGSYV